MKKRHSWLLAIGVLSILVGVLGGLWFYTMTRTVSEPEAEATPEAEPVSAAEVPMVPEASPSATPMAVAMLAPSAAPTPWQLTRQRSVFTPRGETGRGIVDKSGIGFSQSTNTLETPKITSVGKTRDDGPIVASYEPASPYMLTPGSWLSAVLDTGVISDNCEGILAHTSEDVRDSVSQTNLLVPAGSKLLGSAKCNGLRMNQTRINIKWDKLEFPNGGEVILPAIQSADEEGYAGLSGDVDHHYIERWVPTVLAATVSAAISMASSPYSYGAYQQVSPFQLGLQGGARDVGQQAQEDLRTNQQIQPTITLHAGTRIRILVTRRIIFSGAYPG